MSDNKDNGRKSRSYSDINREFSFLDEGVDGIKDRARLGQENKNTYQRREASSQRERPSRNRSRRSERQEEAENLGHTIKMNAASIEAERLRIEKIKREERYRKGQQQKRRRFVAGVLVLFLVIGTALAIRYIGSSSKNTDANTGKTATSDSITKPENPATQPAASGVAGVIQRYNKVGKLTTLLKEGKDGAEKLGEIPLGAYVKNFGAMELFTKVEYDGKSGYVKTEDLVSVENPNELKVVNGYLFVNKQFELPKDFAPGIDKDAQKAFDLMVENAKNDKITLKLAGDFRTYEQQVQAVSNGKNAYGEYYSDGLPVPGGHSEHQTGLAFDVIGADYNLKYNIKFKDTNEYKWLQENAAKYGFILRYPDGKESVTGYKFLPWTYRYVGIEAATEMTKNNYTLEEYLNIVPKTNSVAPATDTNKPSDNKNNDGNNTGTNNNQTDTNTKNNNTGNTDNKNNTDTTNKDGEKKKTNDNTSTKKPETKKKPADSNTNN